MPNVRGAAEVCHEDDDILKDHRRQDDAPVSPQGSRNISVAVDAINNRFTFMITSL